MQNNPPTHDSAAHHPPAAPYHPALTRPISANWPRLRHQIDVVRKYRALLGLGFTHEEVLAMSMDELTERFICNGPTLEEDRQNRAREHAAEVARQAERPSPPPTKKQTAVADAARQLTANTPPGATVFTTVIRAAFPKVRDNLWAAELKALGWTRHRLERENMPRRRVWRTPGATPRRRKPAAQGEPPPTPCPSFVP